MTIDGRRHCRKPGFEAEVAPDTLNIRHCTDCQSPGGSAFRISQRAALPAKQQIWARSALAWVDAIGDAPSRDKD
jgi:hypothetical protein